MANALISKIKLADGTVVDLKDAKGREDFGTLLGENTLAALKTAAWKDAQATWDASTDTKKGELPTVGAVKSYVDSQIENIPTFECVVCAAEASKIPAGAKYKDGTTEITGTMAASADTYKKIYLVKNDNAGAGAYVEYITIRSGAQGSYTYAWEAIGTTAIDLSAYLKTADAEAWTVAGTAFGSGHAVAASDIKTALSLGSLADKDSATGTVTYDKLSAITMNAVDVSGNASVTHSSATTSAITYAPFTPSGTISGTVTANGTIGVVLSQTSTAASIAFSDYTPTGTIVAASSEGTFSALKSAAFTAATSDTGIQIAGTVSAPSISLAFTPIDVISGISASAVLPSFSEGAFSAGNVTFGSFNGGSATTIDTTKFSGGSLGTPTTSVFATDGIVASVNTSASSTAADYELLVFTAVSEASATASAVTAQGSFTGAAFSEGFYTQGTAATWTGSSYTAPTKASDTWNAGSSATFNTAKVVPSGITATADAPTFTGAYYKVATEVDTALKNVEFSGVKVTDALVTGVSYYQATVSSATFTGSSANISASFAGTEASEVIATAVEYQKANASAAFSVSVTPTTKDITFSSATTSVTVA